MQSVFSQLFQLQYGEEMRLISVCLMVFFLALTLNFGVVLAHSDYQFPEANPGQVNEALGKIVPIRFLPSHPFYFLITTKEFFARVFRPTAEKKASFDFIVSGKRLKEAYLLLEKDDEKGTTRGLARYSRQLEKFAEQFEKTKSQNQDMTSLTMETAEGLKDHETLLIAILKKSQEDGLSSGFDVSFDDAFSNFGRVVYLIDDVKPGVKDRYKTITGDGEPLN